MAKRFILLKTYTEKFILLLLHIENIKSHVVPKFEQEISLSKKLCFENIHEHSTRHSNLSSNLLAYKRLKYSPIYRYILSKKDFLYELPNFLINSIVLFYKNVVVFFLVWTRVSKLSASFNFPVNHGLS